MVVADVREEFALRENLSTVWAVVALAACCLLPLLVLGGAGLLGGIAWRKVGLILVGAAVLVLVFSRAAAMTRAGARRSEYPRDPKR